MVQKGVKIIIFTFLCYGLLVATHRGEFWPLSIYPMFSKAGKPWTRALVRELYEGQHQNDWTAKKIKELPGDAFAMDEVGINQNDLANFISKNQVWSNRQIYGLRKYFKGKLGKNNFLIFKVDGHLSKSDPDSVAVYYTPYIFLSGDTTIINPQFKSTAYK